MPDCLPENNAATEPSQVKRSWLKMVGIGAKMGVDNVLELGDGASYLDLGDGLSLLDLG